MSVPLPPGKLAPEFLARLIEAPLPPEVVLGPRIGEDACAIEIGAGTLVAATDPITLTGAGVGAHAVAVNANDVAVTGARPRWFLACVLLPEGSTRGDAEALFAGMLRALDRVGATLVGGHTEVTAAVRQPLVVGQMLGIATERAVPTGGLRPGDAVVQIGPAPVEGAAVLAEILPAERLAEVSAQVLEAARCALDVPGITIVEPALAAARAGAPALHDPTEGGLSAGLHEMADASGVSLVIEPDRILWFEPGVALCGAAGLDPWGTLASGTLLAGFASDRLDATLENLAGAGHAVSVIGRAERGYGVVLSCGMPLARFERDELSRLQPAWGDRTDQAVDQVQFRPWHAERTRHQIALRPVISERTPARSTQTMTRHVKIGEAKTHLSALLSEVEAGENIVICRGQTPIAQFTRIDHAQDHAALQAVMRRERARQQAVTATEILSWRHDGHAR